MTVILEELQNADLHSPPNSTSTVKDLRPGPNRVKENLWTCDKGHEMIITRFAFITAIDDKTLFPHTENYHAQETSYFTREIRDDKRLPGREAGVFRIFLRRG